MAIAVGSVLLLLVIGIVIFLAWLGISTMQCSAQIISFTPLIELGRILPYFYLMMLYHVKY